MVDRGVRGRLQLSGSQGDLFPYSVALCETVDPLVCPAVLRRQEIKTVNHWSRFALVNKRVCVREAHCSLPWIRDESVMWKSFNFNPGITQSPMGWKQFKVNWSVLMLSRQHEFHLAAVICKFARYIKLSKLKKLQCLCKVMQILLGSEKSWHIS